MVTITDLYARKENTMENTKTTETRKDVLQRLLDGEQAAQPGTADDVTYELSVTSDRFAALDIGKDLTSGKSGWCSLIPKTDEDAATLFNAIGSPDKIADHINEIIEVSHIYAEVIQVVSEANGETVNVPRVVLIDQKGKGYQAVSVGIYNAAKRLLQLFGTPETWSKPKKIKIRNISLQGGMHTMSFDLVTEK